MEDSKMKMFLLILAIITALQSVTGFMTLFAGIYAREFDKAKADEMLAVIQQTDVNYYQKIFNADDRTYMEDFKKNYTRKGNKTAVLLGLTMIIFSIFYSVPLIMLALKKEDGDISDELPEGLPEGEKDDTF